MSYNKHTRRNFMKTMGLGVTGLAITGTLNACQRDEAKPNIIFIMSDDHAAQAMSCYGSKINQTPNLDRLAEEGMRLDNCFCTNGICAPSRAVILTGKHSHLNGIIDNRLSFDGSQQTFPKILQQVGYTTAMIGKWHLKSDPTGFDYWNILPGQGHYYNPDLIEMGERKNHIGYVTDIITDISIKWLESIDKSKPFCLMYQHKAPHRNWMPGPQHLTMYDGVEIPEPENLLDDYQGRSPAASEQEMSIAKDMRLGSDLKVSAPNESDTRDKKNWDDLMNRLTEDQRAAWNEAYGSKNDRFNKENPSGTELVKWKYQRYIKDYLRCIASVDDNVGKLLNYLDRKNLSENTIVFYTSDQGFFLGEHGWFDKRFMYEESFRMPLLVRYPKKIKSGSVNDDIVQNLDFAPTFLDFAGCTIPSDMQGRSLKSILNDDTPSDWRQSAYYHYFEYPAVHAVKRHYGIRTKRYKLIHFYYDIDAWELYDLQNDPMEMNNVYELPENVGIVKDLQTELMKLREYYQDTDIQRFLPKKGIKKNHLAMGCPVSLKYPFSPKYKASGAHALTDGLRAPENVSLLPSYNVWQGFEQIDLEATVDLGKKIMINKISTGFLQNVTDWIFLPTIVEYKVSQDGKKFISVGVVKNTMPQNTGETIRKEFEKEVGAREVRFIRVHAKNVGICPDWHVGAGGKAWLFSDEITVQ
jgi:arylsulfatase A-like enzyme